MTLKEKIESNNFIVCGEIGPPRSCDGDVIREKSKYFKGIVDAVNITDNQTALARLSSIASAKILLEEGVELGHDAARAAANGARAGVSSLEHHIEKNPLNAVLIALGIGLVVGFVGRK